MASIIRVFQRKIIIIRVIFMGVDNVEMLIYILLKGWKENIFYSVYQRDSCAW